MSTIAWDGELVAAESQVTYGGSMRASKGVCKLRVQDGIVYACTGQGSLFEPMVDWIKAGGDPEKCPKVTGDHHASVIVFRDGKAFLYKNEVPYPDEMFPPDAWGSGCEIAIGAMRADARRGDIDARRAVAIACEVNVYSSGEIYYVSLRDDFRSLREYRQGEEIGAAIAGRKS